MARGAGDSLLAVPELAASMTAWEAPGLTGHVLDAIDRHVGEAWLRLVARYIETGDGAPSGKTQKVVAAWYRAVEAGPVEKRRTTAPAPNPAGARRGALPIAVGRNAITD